MRKFLIAAILALVPAAASAQQCSSGQCAAPPRVFDGSVARPTLAVAQAAIQVPGKVVEATRARQPVRNLIRRLIPKR